MNYEEANRAHRGGSWSYDAEHARAALRYSWYPSDGNDEMSFRRVSVT